MKEEKTMAIETDAIRSRLRTAISDDILDAVTGGNDDIKGKEDAGVPWDCPFCGAHLILYSAQDGPKHVTQDCEKNPYK